MAAKEYLRYVKRGLKRSGPPIHLTLFVTGKCNLRCRHCFARSELDGLANDTILAVAEAPWSVAEWAVALRFDNPRATVLVLLLG